MLLFEVQSTHVPSVILIIVLFIHWLLEVVISITIVSVAQVIAAAESFADKQS